jgi:hypothetical protein
MNAQVGEIDGDGERAFRAFCDVLTNKLPTSLNTLVGADYPEGMVVPRFEWLFNQAFAAANTTTSEESTWKRLVPHLESAQVAIKVVPHNEAMFAGDPDEIPAGHDLQRMRVLFIRCFACAVAKSQRLPPTAEALDTEFQRCRRAWESDRIEYQAFAPLKGVHISVLEPLPVEYGVALAWREVVGPSALRHLNKHSATPLSTPPMTVLYKPCSLSKAESLPKARLVAAREMRDCVRAFRLATGKNVGSGLFCFVPTEAYFQTGSLPHFTDTMPESAVNDWHATSYGLSDEDMMETQEVAGMLAKPSSDQLSMAVGRFSWSFGRPTLEDKVIDLAIALESVLCLAGGEEQLSYRFRLFGAAILDGIPGHSDAKKLLNALYVARSKIVHGAQRLSDLQKSKRNPLLGLSAQEFVGRSTEVTRTVVLEFLREAAAGRSPTQYCQHLEASMIRCAKKDLGTAEGSASCDGE